MSIKSATIALALAFVPAAALAAPPPVSITLASALEKPTNFVAGNGTFACTASACVSTSDPLLIDERQACAAIARKFGEVKELSVGDRKFDDARLGKCNAKAKK